MDQASARHDTGMHEACHKPTQKGSELYADA